MVRENAQQLELIILQRLKYAHIDYEREYILQNIVKYAEYVFPVSRSGTDGC